MGTLFQFTCSCGYQATMSAGRDRGMMYEVQTVSCAECKALRDAVVREVAPVRRRARRLRCPESPRHRVKVWRRGGKCPRCGEKGGILSDVGLWD